jgi:16S rRNA (uracil1498-N3)-methyltransferase
MRIPRIYHPEPLQTNAKLTLSDFAFQHTVVVLRKKVGDSIILFDGSGQDFNATLLEINRRNAVAETNTSIPMDNESPLKTILIQSLSKADRMDYAIQKSTELGVTEIIPVTTQHSDPAKNTDKKWQHWQKVIIHACEQAYRSQIPLLHPITSLEQALQQVNVDCKILFSLDQQSKELPNSATSAALLVGPIGGFSEAEESAAIASGFQPLHLSERVLRTETAAVVGLSLCQHWWGDFSSNG